MLLHEHSIEVAEDTSRKKQLENDPGSLPETTPAKKPAAKKAPAKKKKEEVKPEEAGKEDA